MLRHLLQQCLAYDMCHNPAEIDWLPVVTLQHKLTDFALNKTETVHSNV